MTPSGTMAEVRSRITNPARNVRRKNGRSRKFRKRPLIEMSERAAAKMITPSSIAETEKSSSPQRKLGTAEIPQMKDHRITWRTIMSQPDS